MRPLIDLLEPQIKDQILDLLAERGNQLLTELRDACSRGDWIEAKAILHRMGSHESGDPVLASVGEQYLREFEASRIPERMRIGVRKNIGSVPLMLFTCKDPTINNWLLSNDWKVVARYRKGDPRTRFMALRHPDNGPSLVLYVSMPGDRLFSATPWKKPLDLYRGTQGEEMHRLAKEMGVPLCNHIKHRCTREWWSKHRCNPHRRVK